MEEIYFEEHCRDLDGLLGYLYAADNCFFPPLSKQVNIEAYAQKLAQHAQLVWYVSEGKRVGLCAFYANQPPRAFLTSLSVLKEHQKHGLAQRMLKEMVEHCRRNGYRQIALEVYKDNIGAQCLYEKMGFAFSAESDEKFLMERMLTEPVHREKM